MVKQIAYSGPDASDTLIRDPFVESLAGAGEMRPRVLEKDWARTALGPIADWPHSLKTAAALVLNSPVPIVMLWGPDGIMIYNDAYSVFAGGRHPDLLGSPVLAGWPEMADFNRRVMAVGLSGGTLSFRDEHLVLHRNDVPEDVWLNLDYSPIRDETGKPAGVLAILLETTQRVVAEQQVRNQKESLRLLNDELEQRVVERTGELAKAYRDLEWRDRKIRRLVDANIVGVFVGNLDDGRILEVNDAFLNMLGYSREDLALLRWTDLTPPDWQAARQRAIAQLAKRGVSDLYEKEYVRKDGSRVPVLVAAAAIEGTKGETVAFVLDLTERKRAEAAQTRAQAELQQARDALAHRQRVNLLGEVAASLAHEIKQPIAAAQIDATVCVRALTHDRVNLEAAREAASRLVKEAMMADEIIQRTTALYRKEALRRGPVNVNELIREMALLLQQEASACAVSIRAEIAEGIPDIMADRVQLQQVLMNLMLNAIDAMKDGGGDLTIASQMSADHELLISVSDTGIGLPSENPEQIFESFVTTKPHGTGMGLAISRSIVEAHGGRLWAMANSLRGATFLFTLPSEAGSSLGEGHRFHAI